MIRFRSFFLMTLGAALVAPRLVAQWGNSGNNIYKSNSGNVGIGTTNPISLLTISGDGSTTVGRLRFFNTTSGTGGYQMGFSGPGSGANVELRNFDDSAFVFATNNTERKRITHTGFVGVGTSNRAALLHLHRDQINTVARIKMTGDGISAGGYQIGFSGTGTTPNVEFWNFENTAAVFATNNAERMRISSNGSVGIGNASPQYTLDVSGTAHVSGNMTVDGNLAAKYQDVAEWVPTSEPLDAGSVVILDSERTNMVKASRSPYDMSAAGVVTKNPGIVLGEPSASKAQIATTGRVKVHVDASHGPIKIGDLLVTGDRRGTAMKSEPIDVGGIKLQRPGTVIGKALEPL